MLTCADVCFPSGTRKVVRTPTNPFEVAGTVEVFVPKEIIARRIQEISAGINKGRKSDHYLKKMCVLLPFEKSLGFLY